MIDHIDVGINIKNAEKKLIHLPNTISVKTTYSIILGCSHHITSDVFGYYFKPVFYGQTIHKWLLKICALHI